MASTATQFIDDINVLFPVSGVDNDTQGFRDNYTTIKNGMQALANEIEDLQRDPVAQVTSFNTLTDLNVAGPATVTSLVVNGFDITPDNSGNFTPLGLITDNGVVNNLTTKELTIQTQSSSSSSSITYSPYNRLLIDGVKSIALTNSTVTESRTFSSWEGSGSPFLISTLTLNSTVGLAVGYSFKFYSTETNIHTITAINTLTNKITTDGFDPSDPNLSPSGTITVTNASILGTWAGRAPTNALGRPGDVRGMFYADSDYLYVCDRDYRDGSENIWIYISNLTNLTVGSYQGNAPATSKGQPGDKRGMFFANASYIYVCTQDYTNGAADIWVRSAAGTGW